MLRHCDPAAHAPASARGSALPGLCKTVLAPGLVDDQRHGIRQVETAVAGTHRNMKMMRRRHPCQHLRGETARLGAEDQGIARAKARRTIGAATAGFDTEQPRAFERSKTVREA